MLNEVEPLLSEEEEEEEEEEVLRAAMNEVESPARGPLAIYLIRLIRNVGCKVSSRNPNFVWGSGSKAPSHSSPAFDHATQPPRCTLPCSPRRSGPRPQYVGL